MGEQDVLEARERDFKQFMKNKTTNTREKQENWYYVQQFDETCSICEHGEDDPYLMYGESFQCPHCGVVAWNGWCKRFEMDKRSGGSVL